MSEKAWAPPESDILAPEDSWSPPEGDELSAEKAPRPNAIIRGGRRVQKTALDMALAPLDMINAGAKVAGWVFGLGYHETPNMIPTQRTRHYLAQQGLIPDPNQPAEGVVEQAGEILGSAIIPTAGAMYYGKRLLAESILQMERLGVIQNLSVSTARAPTATAVGEVIAATGGGIAREAAIVNNASPSMTLLAEMTGSFVPAGVFGLAGNVNIFRGAWNTFTKHLAPFTKAGAWPRAAKALQRRSVDPKAAAKKIDVTSKIGPARQTEDTGLLGLERAVFDESPGLRTKSEEDLALIREEIKRQAALFGGDHDRVLKILKEGRQYLLDMIDLRMARAAQHLEYKLSQLDSGASPREISAVSREVLQEALDDARAAESIIWGKVNSKTPIEASHGQDMLDAIVAARNVHSDPDDIPKWVFNSLKRYHISNKTLKQLQKAGLADADGNIDPQILPSLIDQGFITPQTYAFDDVKTIRSRLLDEIRTERAKDAPNRNKIRILNNIANGDPEKGLPGLIDDLGDSGVEYADAAREYSAKLNSRFSTGRVGQVLGYQRTGGKAYTPEETLDYVLSGRDPTANVRQMIEAAPETRGVIQDYLHQEFLAQATKQDGTLDPKAAQRFIDKWERRGAFEVFPAMRDEFLQTKDAGFSADLWRQRDIQVRRQIINDRAKSRVKLYIDNDPGEEMAEALRSKRPMLVIRSVVKKLDGDEVALDGLRDAFVTELMRQADSGVKFGKYLDNYKNVMRELKITQTEYERLQNIAKHMRQVEAKPTNVPSNIVDDKPAQFIEIFARVAAAQAGGRLGKASAGGSLQTAQIFSSRVQRLLTRLTQDKARELLIRAHRDPVLYRALLTSGNAPPGKVEKAVSTLEAYLIGAGIVIGSDLATPGEAAAPEGP
jgi:hypothetical protein